MPERISSLSVVSPKYKSIEGQSYENEEQSCFPIVGVTGRSDCRFAQASFSTSMGFYIVFLEE